MDIFVKLIYDAALNWPDKIVSTASLNDPNRFHVYRIDGFLKSSFGCLGLYPKTSNRQSVKLDGDGQVIN